MRFIYKNKEYELLELTDVGGNSAGMMVVFEIQYVSMENGKKTYHSEEDFLEQKEDIFKERRFINYFFYDDDNINSLVELAQDFIDNQWNKDFNELGYHLMAIRKAQKEFDDDLKNNYSTKGSLETLDDTIHDLESWIKDNIKLEEEWR